jgi:lambda repressor-like predicted transcriptional regulator
MAYRRKPGLLSDVLSRQEIERIAELRAQGWTLQQLADAYQVHRNTIRNVLRRRDIERKRDAIS